MNKNIRSTYFNESLLVVFLLGAGCLCAASASADVPRFVDPPFIQTGVYCSAIMTADFNGDGIPDVGSVDRYGNQVGVTLGNGDGTFQSTQIYNVGQGPSDMKIADLNGDGIPDLVVPLQAKHQVVVLLGNGDGTFSMPVRFESGNGPSSVALGDLNEDGKIDVVVSNVSGLTQGISVLRGNGDGTLQSPTSYATGNSTNSVVLADFNGDGHLDAAVVNSGSETFSILLGNGDGTFGTAVSYPTPYLTPFYLVVADFNQDSHPDLAVTYDSSNLNVSVFLGNGDGTFQTAIDTVTAFSSPSSFVAGDLNGDSIPDLAIGDGFLTVLLGKGDGTFEAPVSYTNAGVVTLGQFDGTGGIDAVAFEQRDVAGFALIAGNPDGTFNAPRSFPAPPIQIWSAASADLDQDGSPDLVLAGESPFDGQGQVSVYLNTGNGILAPRVDYLTGNNTMGVAIGDLNNDGMPDMVAANEGDNTVSVLLGKGGGLFQNPAEYSVGGDPWSVVIADFNNDGIEDLATINTNSWSISILIGAGGGSFPTHTELYPGLAFPPGIAVGDLNGDGNADLVVIGEQYAQPYDVVSVYLGNGDGTFGVPTAYQVTVGTGLQARIKIGDVDGDTKPDLVAANFGVDVLLNNGDGTFRGPVTTDLSLSLGSLQSGDIDGNGSLDLVLGTYYYANGLLFGNGDGTFSPSKHSFTFGVATALADFNNDGALDVASGTTILLNTGGSHVSLMSSENPSHSGEKVTFHARVTPTVTSAVPTGTVEFLDGDKTLGTATLVDGKTRFSISSLSVGRHRIQASYSGDGVFVPRKSKTKTQIVQP
jgi:Bacterial Ig-like domain (group 3)/FG-GAP-like repeat/FG-GAP repeat